MENRQHQEMVEIRVDLGGSNKELDKEEKHIGRESHNEEEVIQIRVEGKGREVAEEIKVKQEVVSRKEFKQFDIVKSTPALNVPSSCLADQQINQTNVERHNRIMQEWQLLKKGLPDSIYVRVYQQRTDILEAFVVGGAGTPYRDGLFLFHIIFPSNYPKVPPKLYFKTKPRGGLCMDFLEYGGGINGIDIRQIKGLEKWNSKKSSILEMLVAIRQSFHIEKPYFRDHNMNDLRLVEAIEKGYKLDESYDCDERVFKTKCWTILGILAKPPKVFEEFVCQHFRDRAEAILIACRPYYRLKYGDHPIYETKFCDEYRQSMANTYVKLLKAFIKNGSSLDDYVGDINLEDDFDYIQPPPPPTKPRWHPLIAKY
ncbi:putative ubiquitin-conjugating enzyme E2 38 [Papaver somniferum]|uniref:putative ubiquitin-conjugating enzyme E2 38 n=1 Tax=Papaver somniferum TaxID=3469 RepID=UPI000E703E81|nr:putative ubiquitin-conjugating enzyme E2 38 [Papaver somniferum]